MSEGGIVDRMLLSRQLEQDRRQHRQNKKYSLTKQLDKTKPAVVTDQWRQVDNQKSEINSLQNTLNTKYDNL